MVSLYVKAKEESDVVLPEGYERLEWIGTTDLWNLNLGAGIDSTKSEPFILTIKGNKVDTSDGAYFGARGSDGSYAELAYASGVLEYRYNLGDVEVLNIDITSECVLEARFYYDSGYTEIWYNGALVSEVPSVYFPDGVSFHIGGTNDSGTALLKSPTRLNRVEASYGEISSAGSYRVQERDAYSALRLSDLVAGLYDFSTDTFAGNANILYEDTGWNEVSVSDVTPISYKYELVSDDVLSQFTTVHSTSLDIPFTISNRKALGADVNVSDYARRSWNYRIFDNGVLVDSGVMIPDACTEEGLTVHLYSSTIAAISKIKDMTWDDYLKCLGYNLGKRAEVSVQNYILNSQNGLIIKSPSNRWTAMLGVGNIGIPSNSLVEFDTSSPTTYTANAGNNTIFRKNKYTVGDYQYTAEVRWWQLLPALDVQTFLEMVCRYAGISLSGTGDIYQDAAVLMPSLLSNSEQMSIGSTVIQPSGLPTYTTNPYTFVAGSGVYGTIRVTWDDAWSGYKSRGQKYTKFQVKENGTTIKTGTLQDGDRSIDIIATAGRTYTIYLQGQIYTRGGTTDVAIDSIWKSSDAFVLNKTMPSVIDLQLWMKSFPNIYDLFCDLCKAFDLRFNGKNLCPAIDYYSNTVKDISGYCSEYKAVPYPVPYKTVRINTDTVDGLWYGDEYKDRHEYSYGTKRYMTDYPVNSEKDYYDFKVLKFSYSNGPYDFYTKKLVSGYERLVECVDNERKQIDMTGCLVYTQRNSASIYYFTVDAIIPSTEYDSRLKYMDDYTERENYDYTRFPSCHAWQGSPLYVETPDELPNGISQIPMYTVENPSVLEDTLVEPVIEVEMQLTKFLNKNGMTINDFLCGVYWYHNDLWVVYSIDSYAPDMSSATIKFQRFVKND